MSADLHQFAAICRRGAPSRAELTGITCRVWLCNPFFVANLSYWSAFCIDWQARPNGLAYKTQGVRPACLPPFTRVAR